MHQSTLAIITVLAAGTDEHPAHPIAPGGAPPHVEHPIPPQASHPIVIPPTDGRPPLIIWGGGNENFPTNPIVIRPGNPPLIIWGGGNEPMPTPPIELPPAHDEIWGGANEPFPTPPIVIPPGQEPPTKITVIVHKGDQWKAITFVETDAADKPRPGAPKH
jgi:hypothetical protein